MRCVGPCARRNCLMYVMQNCVIEIRHDVVRFAEHFRIILSEDVACRERLGVTKLEMNTNPFTHMISFR